MTMPGRGSLRTVLGLSISFILTFTILPVANAANYTISYDANAGYVGAVSQAGITSGAVPTPTSVAQGTVVTVAPQGDLARQGFTFAGWNDRQDGTGITYAPGSGSFTLGAANVTLWAKWEIPQAARMIGSGGSIITVSDPGAIDTNGYCLSSGVRGITSDGTYIYYRSSRSIGYICKTTPAGLIQQVIAVSGLASIEENAIAIVFGNGCLFLRADSGTTLNSIKCISTSDWVMRDVALNGSTLPTGSFWLYGNFIQFPDGRIGSVGTSVPAASWKGGGQVGTGPGQCPVNMFCKVLRLFSVSGSGSTVSTSYSTDFVLVDTVSGWPSDDHGIATDGTYVYQVRHARGYKVWALQASSPSYLVFNGDSDGSLTSPSCGATTGLTGTYCQITYPVTAASAGGALVNSTYFGRAHGLNRYIIGNYDYAANVNTKYWLSDSVVPPPGPGNPDIVSPSYTSTDTFTVTENIATSFNAATIVVNESSTLTIASGVDRLLFDIIRADTASAYIRFKSSPDFEGPTDSGGNNTYNITINATDLAGNIGIRAINIRVTNLSEDSSTSPPSVSGNVYKGIVISLTVTVNTLGKVRFFMDGKKIANCLAVPTSGTYPNYTASCSWKPTVTARHSVVATLTPSDNTFSPSTSQVGTFWVLKRTNLR